MFSTLKYIRNGANAFLTKSKKIECIEKSYKNPKKASVTAYLLSTVALQLRFQHFPKVVLTVASFFNLVIFTSSRSFVVTDLW